MKGKLIVLKKKTGVSYQVSFTSPKGTETTAAVSGQAKCFRDGDASDGVEVELELQKGQPAKVTIPGKPEVKGHTVQRTPPSRGSGDSQRGGPATRGGAERGPASTEARAPYNFISAQNPVGFSMVPGTRRYSGTIHCRLIALTPLLVSGPQTDKSNGQAERRFFEVGGVPTIPGSSLKGMVRSAIEVLSCAPLGDGLSARKVAYRDVNSADQESAYGRRFRGGAEELCAGMLEENGAERTIVPCSWMRFDGLELGIEAPDRMSACQKYKARKETGPIDFRDSGGTTEHGDPIACRAPAGPGSLRGIPVFTGGFPNVKYYDYVFYNRRQEQKLRVPREVWDDFIDQLSPAQEQLRDYFRESKQSSIPIFFLRRQGADGDAVTAIGLTRYFRLVAPNQPRNLAAKLTTGISLPERMFGRVAQSGGVSIGGRVRFHAATPARRANGAAPAAAQFPANGNLVAGNPSATAVNLYLEQDTQAVKLRLGSIHQNEGLSTFASDTPVLRGRKLYWHRMSPSAPPPPNSNLNVQSRYFPLAARSEFEFSVTFERLDDIELGALLESLDLPDGAAHKLGLGKAFGLGSVRVDIDPNRTTVQEDRSRYSALRARFAETADGRALFESCRGEFRSAVTAGCMTAGRPKADFESLSHVREFRIMTSFKSPRDPQEISYMPLNGNDTPSYRMKPILRKPLDIPPAP